MSVLSDGNSYAAQLKSLSLLGALLQLDRALLVGTAVGLQLQMPRSSEILELRGQVVRTEASEGRHAVAVMFGPLPPSVKAKIDSVFTA